MAQEEQNQRGSSGTGSSGMVGGGGGGGGSAVGISKSSKKQKQKKVPQRGLGVAQLERIRIEELKKKDAAGAIAATAILPPPQPIIPQDSVDNAFVRDSLANTGNSEVLEMGRGIGGIMVRGNVQRNSAFAIRSNWAPQGETDHVWPLPGPIPGVQLGYLNQQMNVIVPPAPISSNSSSKPSPLLNLQMEPPSNQNYNYTQALPRVEKAVSMKRTHPFSLEDPPPVALSHKITHHIDLTDESTSHGGGIMFRNEYPDGLSISGSRYTPESNSKKGLRDHCILREVLTLAPPSTPSTWMNSKPVDPLPLHHEPRHLDQGHLEELGIFQQGSIKVGQQHLLHYSFLPPSIPHLTLAGSESKYGNGEDQELIDLELRL